MDIREISLTISSSIGSVSGIYNIPEKSNCIITLAHGAGAGMTHPFMETLAILLAEIGVATLRFNFPFIENGKRRPDFAAVAHKTIEAAIHHAHESFSSLPLFVSGKSFGGRMSSQYLSLHSNAKVKGIIFYGFPMHSIGKPSTERAEHLKDVKVPMLFLQGTKDEMATWSLMETLCLSLPLATLVKIEGANHAFKAGKQNSVPVLAEEAKNWMEKII